VSDLLIAAVIALLVVCACTPGKDLHTDRERAMLLHCETFPDADICRKLISESVDKRKH